MANMYGAQCCLKITESIISHRHEIMDDLIKVKLHRPFAQFCQIASRITPIKGGLPKHLRQFEAWHLVETIWQSAQNLAECLSSRSGIPATCRCWCRESTYCAD